MTNGDSIVRVVNSRGADIARISDSENFAKYLSILIESGIFEFVGTCIYADEQLRIGDYFVIQIDCYILKTAFDGLRANQGDEDDRALKFFHNASDETADEKIMRLRQQGLVYLFSQLNVESVVPDYVRAKLGAKNLLANMIKANDVPNTQQPDAAATLGGDVTASTDETDPDEFLPDQMDALYKRSTQVQDLNLTEVEPPTSFNMDLRPYQKKGLDWLIRRETHETPANGTQEDEDVDKTEPMNPLWQEFKWPQQPASLMSPGSDEDEPDTQDCFYANLYNGDLSLAFPKQKKSVRGGILADEMGLGKTISTMALIHSNRYSAALQPQPVGPHFAKYTTLVVAPMSLLSQWESEGYAASKPGHTRILIYYGSATTSSINLRRLLCGPDARSFAPHVIITSYGTLVSEHNMLEQFKKRNKEVHDSDLALFNLYSVEFFRVVLDEGHTIKNRSTKAAKACYAVRADRRWVLTGTPIVNKLEDLFSLVKFLKVEPWNNFSFWKTFITVPFMSKDFEKAVNVVQSVMEPLLLRRTKDMRQPDGTPLVALPEKTISIERVSLGRDEQSLYEWIFYRARNAFNDSLSSGSALKSYSSIMTQILRLRQLCDHPAMVTKALLATQKLAQEKAHPDIAGAFLPGGNDIDAEMQELIKRIEARQKSPSPAAAADNVGEGADTVGEEVKSSFGMEVVETILKGSSSECPICMADRIPLDDQAVTRCWHMACLACLKGHIEFQTRKGETDVRCHMCREAVSLDTIYLVKQRDPAEPHSIYLQRYDPAQENENAGSSGNRQQQSAKVEALLRHLHETKLQSPLTKSVVFSQFTEFLDIIEHELAAQRGFRVLRFDGTMSQAERAKVLAKFKQPDDPHSPPKPMIMLISLKAGGVGLNLVSASQVFLMDPWWSWAIESQAIDRIHRLGQLRPVRVVRFIVDGSVEERILKIQDRKKFLASSTIGMSEQEQKEQRLEDFKAIFEDVPNWTT
ncbi:hypothetical protein D0Z00_002539 [Geotrichum galactomycetum]|uniref:Uncharacterized protein n=1 Tax=Geotrichum galactomycetum TaxID=27317 RepID=A0ACB6V3V8_9ASCO|nr:hypothetical protein D0Z00_002539 [Geotrichum candidum]